LVADDFFTRGAEGAGDDPVGFFTEAAGAVGGFAGD
jgi:hypothetical protein